MGIGRSTKQQDFGPTAAIGRFNPEAMYDDWREGRTDPEFARFTDGGKVHVLRTAFDPESFDTRVLLVGVGQRPSDPPPEDASMAHWLLGKQVGLCGAMGAPGELFGISTFSDEALCVACGRSVPQDISHRLFEHDTEVE